MSFYLYLLLGFLGGIPAGMGMGGGTVTIPLLVLVGGVEQKIAQCANLFSFLPMSVGALKTHAENGLLKTDGLLWVVLPALALSAISVSLAAALPSSILRRGFGVFLIGLSFVGFYKEWAGKNKKKTDIANG
ncbi:MAG: sulfite exporter TauE/SafE family protein [Clostridia bacterium]|nr:sulfite exporter TauE/SafE family protein [Clostridia bacterium]